MMKKRWLYLVVIPLLAVGFLLWKNAGRKSFETDGEPSSASAQKYLNRPVAAGATTQAASTAPAAEAPTAKPAVMEPTAPDDDSRGRAGIGALKPFNERVQAERRQDFARKYGTGKTIANAGVAFEVMGLRAVPLSQYDRGSGTAVTERLGYAFVPSDEADSALVTKTGGMPVVAQSSNGTLGIVTGTVIVNLKDLADAQGLARDHALKLKYVDQDLLQAYYESPSSQPLTAVMQTLSQQPGVKAVRLEIVQTRKRF